MAALSFRYLSTFSALRASISQPIGKEAVSHSHGGYLKWRNLFFFVCCPAIALSYVNAKMEEHEEKPEFKKYPFLRIRNKKFPWRDGVQTLFHNPEKNPTPEGYEV